MLIRYFTDTDAATEIAQSYNMGNLLPWEESSLFFMGIIFFHGLENIPVFSVFGSSSELFFRILYVGVF
jgi:hypothetical protein